MKIVVNRKRLTNFRVKGIYSPAVYQSFADGLPGGHFYSREDAEVYVSFARELGTGAASPTPPESDR